MHHKGIDLKNALEFVRQFRPEIAPNTGFRKQLEEFQVVMTNRE